MSLINDMLRDLDRRGAGPRGDIETDGHRYPRAARAKTPWLAVPAVLALVGAGAWYGVWSQPSKTAEVALKTEAPEAFEPNVEKTTNVKPGHGADETAREDTPAEPEPVDSNPADTAGAPALAEALTAAPEPDVEPNRDARIESLLASAREAHARDRLTRPVGNNAYEYYQQVLALKAEQPEALAGLAAIAQRYRELAEAAMDRQALHLARRFLQRARSVRPGAEGIQASEQRLAKLEASESGAAPASTVEATSEASSPEASGSQEEAALSVRPDPASVDRRAAAKAQQLWSAGEPERARSLLETTLAGWSFESARPRSSADLLFDLYLDSGADVPARSLLEKGFWADDEKTQRRARLALRAGDVEGALALLESGAGQARGNESYRALQARLYYQQQRFEQAAGHYRSLLRDMGPRPEYWLGLGLAEDARERSAEALRAFERALGTGAYRGDAEVQKYLEQRISALKQTFDQSRET